MLMLMGSIFIVLVAAIIGFFTLYKKFRFQQEDKETTSSSLSPSASVTRNWKHHDVFPSFHGTDVRKNVLSHILESFKRKGIDSFIDNNIERSKSIGPELKEAIKAAKISVVLLSKNYASSSWCLDELAEIMKCRKESGQIVMPIFYEVEPTDIKKQTGDFGNAFNKNCKGKTKENIVRWTNALKDVAQIAGEHSRNWENDAAMIEKIAIDVSNMLNMFTPSRDLDVFVGMRAHMEELEQLLRLDLDEVRMIGIWGPPGIGKTSIARFLFNQISNSFQLGAIVYINERYPRPCLDEYNTQLQLQNQMLSQIINHKGIMISHLGVAQERLKDKKVILVIDEVDHQGQLIALAKETGWFGPGSRIIITTENLRVLKTHRIDHIYKVKYPSSEHAFEIFCMHAFGKKYPDDGFYELACAVTDLAGELPLGLKILGSALRGMSKEEWELEMPTLKNCLNGEIKSIIKFSYDVLSDEEKDLFLYIACFFDFYSPIHQVEELLAKNFTNVRQSLRVLDEKSFISINRSGIIELHTLLKKFGRETSRKQYVHGIAKRQLLVDARDISDVTVDHKKLIGIRLKDADSDEVLSISEKAIERMSDVQFVSITGNSERLHSLLHHSQRIRYLHWLNFEDICLPSTFNTESLIELGMYNSKLQKLWEGTKPLKSLKWMNLTSSKDLKELPDLSTATNLKSLVLYNCINLVELADLSTATNLKSLVLYNCINLVELPTIGNSVELLDLDNCSSLMNLPSSINATNLKDLILSNCSRLVELPTIGNSVERLDLHNCSSLVELSPSIGTAKNIETLDISGCSSLVKLPSSIGDIASLREFILCNFSSLLELPSSIGTATKLEKLDLSGCSSLVNLPSSIGDITNLREFNLSDCSTLVELPSSIGNLQQLKELSLCGCLKLEALPTNINLKSLNKLNLRNCTQLNIFPEISTSIKYLELDGTAVKEVPLSIMSWSPLSDFHMSYFESLKNFGHALDLITELVFKSADIHEVASWVRGMSHLRVLKLHDCNNLVSLPQLSDSLMCIDADNCKSLERLDCSFNNPNICLMFTNCFKLNQEAINLIMLTSTREYVVLPGRQVPTCFNYRSTAGGSLTIKLNETSLPTSLRFKACFTLVKGNEEIRDDDESWRSVDIYVIHKHMKKFGVNRPITEHIYTFEVEVSEVTSTELVFEFETGSNKWEVGECGLLQILEVPSC